MTVSILVNGELSDVIPAGDRGLAYGDGVFETLRFTAGHPQLWQGHMDRLQRGCQRLALPVPDQALLLREARTVAAGERDCVVKIIITRGSGGRGYAPPSAPQPNRVVSLHALPPGLEDDARRGVHGHICEQRIALQPSLRGIKHLNRLEYVLAAAELAHAPGQVGIVLNTEEFVISSVHANLFLVVNGQLLTPRMDRCGVHGVLRAYLQRDFKNRLELRRVTLDLMAAASEVFLASSVRGVVPLRSVGEWHWDPGPVTRDMQQWHQDLVQAA